MTFSAFLNDLSRKHGSVLIPNPYDPASDIGRECRYISENAEVLRRAGIVLPEIHDSLDRDYVLKSLTQYYGETFKALPDETTRKSVMRVHASIRRIRAALAKEVATL